MDERRDDAMRGVGAEGSIGAWRLVRSLLLVCGAFWIAVHLIASYDWEQGGKRAVLLGMVGVTGVGLTMSSHPCRRVAWRWLLAGWMAVAIVFVLLLGGALPGRRDFAALLLCTLPAMGLALWHPMRGRRGVVLLALVLILMSLFCRRSLYFVDCAQVARISDIGGTTLKAGQLLLSGKNFYVEPIDRDPPIWHEQSRYMGYKYTPVMVLAYLPLGALWREVGILATNLLLDLAVVALLVLLGRKAHSLEAGVAAAILFLVPGIVPYELYRRGVTDLAAVVPLLCAFLLLERRPMLAGLALGLSLSAKLLPGAAVLLCCVPARGRLGYVLGLALGALPCLAFLSWSPAAFWDNVVLFGLRRDIDSTSWLMGMPSGVTVLAKYAGLAALLGIGLLAILRRPALLERTGLALLCVLVTLLTGPVCHGNYQLWWIPLVALLLAGSFFGGDAHFNELATADAREAGPKAGDCQTHFVQ